MSKIPFSQNSQSSGEQTLDNPTNQYKITAELSMVKERHVAPEERELGP